MTRDGEEERDVECERRPPLKIEVLGPRSLPEILILYEDIFVR